MRYKFYREHKYVSFRFSELERLIARTDFRNDDEIEAVKEEFEALIELLEGHANYEDSMLHQMLIKKQSEVYKQIEEDHDQLDAQITALRELLNKISAAQAEQERIEAGYQFYLWFRKFNGDNLIHLHEEETIILPELQRLYSDEELRKVEFATYTIMSAQELLEMLQELFPQMNPSDWEVFLKDIKDSQPTQFAQVWNGIKEIMTPKQQEYFIKKLALAP